MAGQVMASPQWSDRFRAFFERHPDFDLMRFDFWHRTHRRALVVAEGDEGHGTIEQLAAYQRLLRVCHDTALEVDYLVAGVADGVDLATRLIDAGFRSAHHIARMPRSRFLRQHRALFGGHEPLARAVHDRAVQIKERVKHFVANIRDTVASPAYGKGLYANLDPALADYVKEIPSYQDLFGTLDYCGCEECQSLFSPAAYFLDIMRITDQYITEPNAHRIPPGWSLEARRPDLFTRELTCANTTTVRPYLQVVNEILEAKLTGDLVMPAFQTLAIAPYPFNLPAVTPLSEIRLTLEPLKTTLLDLYRSILDPAPIAYGFTDVALAREALGVSPELYQLVTTPNASVAGVSASYGYQNVEQHLPADGPGTITVTAGTLTATGVGVDFQQVLVKGQQIGVGVDIRTVKDITSPTTLLVDVAWSVPANGATYRMYPVDDLSSVSEFLYRTNLTLDQLNALFLQGLSPAEIAAGVANTFFINATGESLPYLHIDRSIGGDTDNPVQRIAGLSLKRLDRVSRFLRLSQTTGLDPATLNWMLVTAGAAEITEAFVLELASLAQMANVTELSPLQIAAFLHDMKTIGRGDGSAPADLFDVTFNNPALLTANPYTSPEPVPFDPSRPLAWYVGETEETPAAAGTAQAGTQSSITLAASSPAENGYFNGLAVAIVNGTGKGESRIIRAYNGTSKVADLYVNWTTAPDASSQYRVTNQSTLVARLAAALGVSTPDLTTVGQYYLASTGLNKPIALTLPVLTELYRLTKLAPIYQLTIDEYLNVLALAKTPNYQSLARGNQQSARLSELQSIVSVIVWLQLATLTIYEWRYVLTGLRSRYLRLAFTNDDIEPFVRRLAAASTETHLTFGQLTAAGLTSDRAEALFKELIARQFITAAGIALVNAPAYDSAAAQFPIASTAFAWPSLITDEESKEIFAILTQQRPPIIKPIDANQGTLGIEYIPGQPLDFLFINDPLANRKRQRVESVLTSTRVRIVFTEYAPRLPVADVAFVSNDIDTAVSRAVFSALVSAAPPILIAPNGATAGALSADFTRETPLPFLFVSKGAGQTRSITAYDGTTKLATISPAWSTIPDYFTTYLVTTIVSQGTVHAATENSITLAADTSPEPNAYTGMQVTVTSGEGAGQTRTIDAYDGQTKVALITPAWDTMPTTSSTYQVGVIVTQGTAQAGGADTITLGDNASRDSGTYVNQTITLIADSKAAVKVDQVRNVLLATKSTVDNVIGILAGVRSRQEQAVLSGIGEFLDAGVVLLGALLPFSTPDAGVSVAPYLPDILTPPLNGAIDPRVIALVDGLSRWSLFAQRLNFTQPELQSIARRPDHFQITKTESMTLANVQTLTAFKAFVEPRANSAAILQYFDIPPATTCPSPKTLALTAATGWDAGDVCQLIGLFWPTDSQAAANTMSALLRLQVPFGLIDATGANADYLVRMSRLAPLVLDNGSGGVDQAAWHTYTTALDSTLGVVSARYGDGFGSVSTSITEQTNVVRRDALLPFAIWHLNKDHASIKTASDVYQFLLIDVEMGGAATTSYIAQGIGSVQLYMQRTRMGLEPGVDTAEIPEVWWAWMSGYRLWEVNRKVFVYPESYIDPALRKNATPAFYALEENLRQGDVNKATVREAYVRYFEDFMIVAQLTHVAGYQTHETRLAGEQTLETLYYVGRTSTTPYNYFVRTRTRTSTCGTDVWSPWRRVNITINAAFVTPVFAFSHLFLFWTESSFTKSSKVSDNKSQSQSIWQAVTKFTFQTVNGEWVTPQDIEHPLPIGVDFNFNQPSYAPFIETMYDRAQQFWQQPYAQRIARGIPANGALTLVKGLTVAAGASSDFLRQVKQGDQIWVAGQERRVVLVMPASQQLLVDLPWQASAFGAPFKVIPQDKTLNTFPTFKGDGTIQFVKGFIQVLGTGTRFTAEVSVGDDIQAEGETRTVISIANNTSLLVDAPWEKDSAAQGIGDLVITPHLTVVGGKGTAFQQQLQVGSKITAINQTRTVTAVMATQILIDTPFVVNDITDASFTIMGGVDFTVIPRTNGAEQLVMFYGAGLDVAKTPAPPPTVAVDDAPAYVPVWPNPGDDPFIASLNDYNGEMYQALTVAGIARNDQLSGSVTATRSGILSEELLSDSGRVVAVDYNPSTAEASLPVRLLLSRENDRLSVAPGNSLMANVFWADNVPTTVGLDPTPANARPLMYHVAGAEASLFGIGNRVGWYLFNNLSESYLINLVDPNAGFLGSMAFLRSYALPRTRNDLRLDFGAFTTTNTAFDAMKFRVTRLSTSVAAKLRSRLFIGGVDFLLTLDSQQLPEIPFSSFYEVPGQNDPPPTLEAATLPPSQMDFNGAYGPYFWEIFFHAPLLVADTLRLHQRFDEAKQWYEYIFTPTGDPRGDLAHPNDRYWSFLPFRSMTIPSLTEILTNRCQIDAFNDDPFNPDAIASLRISAYAKATVIKYLENIIDWADALFTVDTRESIDQAQNLYILASDLLGPRPVRVEECPKPVPKNFNQIKAEYPEGIPEFLIQAENTPFVAACGCTTQFAEVPFNEIDSYFCVPINTELTQFWDTIDDRLFKIRHGLNIQGVARPLALFGPPLNPRSVIAAFGAAGTSLPLGFAAEAPVPPFRFAPLVMQAKNVLGDVIRLGNSLLSALQQKDAEALAQLQVTQQGVLLNLNTLLKEEAIKQVDAQRDALTASRASAEARRKHYQDLLDKGLLPEEVLQVVMMGTATALSTISVIFKTAAAIGYAAPQAGSPFAMTYGGQQLGSNLTQAGAALDIGAQIAQFAAQGMGLRAAWTRRDQDWQLQVTVAEYDVEQLDAQLAANAISKTMAQRELVIQNTQVAQNREIDDFYRKKFTNQALYNWMAGQLSATYFQTYSLAFDLARLAQRAYQFEYSTSTEFLTFSYWDSLHKGLLAGEALLLSVNQMEKMYSQQASRALEVQRVISLKQIDPLAFLTFVKTGECLFTLTERLFDSDYPGQYRRRVKTLSVTMPAVVGPYQNIKATLAQVSDHIVNEPNVAAVKFLLGEPPGQDIPPGVLRSNVRGYQQIALSTGQNDSGLFQVDLSDPRYLPFEGTGAVSSWKLSMAPANNPIDYASISDVILQLSYTALDGGESFRASVNRLPALRERSWSTLLSLAQQYGSDWYAFLHVTPSPVTQSLTFATPSFAAPNIRDARIVELFVKLQVPAAANVSSPNAYITLRFNARDSLSFAPTPTGEYAATLTRPVRVADLAASLAFDFDLAKTPASLLKDGHINPDVLQNLIVVFFLAGTV